MVWKCYPILANAQDLGVPEALTKYRGETMAIAATGATKFSMMSTKFKVGGAALALATAATITPTVAQATPNLAPFSEAIGAGTSLVVDSAAINASATSTCNGANFDLACYAVEGAAAGTAAFVRGAVIFIGTIAYVIVQGTGQILKLVGSVLPGPIGDVFESAGDGVLVLANDVAKIFRVGPYLGA
jgi:hypothetical protein